VLTHQKTEHRQIDDINSWLVLCPRKSWAVCRRSAMPPKKSWASNLTFSYIPENRGQSFVDLLSPRNTGIDDD